MKKNNRYMRNYLLQPSLQLKIGLLTLVATVLFSCACIWVLSSAFDVLFHSILSLTDIPEVILDEVQTTFIDTAGWIILLVVLYAIINLGISILLTHRLVGPTIAFRRHIQALTNGLYNSRVILRKSDAFIEVAEDLNTLAETLESKGS